MKYFLRTTQDWENTGIIEWSPGKDKWYPILDDRVMPKEKRDKLIREILPELHKTRNKIMFHGYYNRALKELHIITFPHKIWITTEELERDLMFIEDMHILDID